MLKDKKKNGNRITNIPECRDLLPDRSKGEVLTSQTLDRKILTPYYFTVHLYRMLSEDSCTSYRREKIMVYQENKHNRFFFSEADMLFIGARKKVK